MVVDDLTDSLFIVCHMVQRLLMDDAFGEKGSILFKPPNTDCVGCPITQEGEPLVVDSCINSSFGG